MYKLTENVIGAEVQRKIDTFYPDGRPRCLKRGDYLTIRELEKFSPTNLDALVNASYLHIQHGGGPAQPGKRFIIMTGKNEFGVIEGRKINTKPLSKEDADKLAAE